MQPDIREDDGRPVAIGLIRGDVSGPDAPRHSVAVERHARTLGLRYIYTPWPPEGTADRIGYALGVAAGLDVAVIVVFDTTQVDNQPAWICEDFDLETVCPPETWTRTVHPVPIETGLGETSRCRSSWQIVRQCRNMLSDNGPDIAEARSRFPRGSKWQPSSRELLELFVEAIRKWAEDSIEGASAKQARESMPEGESGNLYFTGASDGWEAGWFISGGVVQILGITDPAGVAQGSMDIEPLSACYDLMPRALWDKIHEEAKQIISTVVTEADR